MLDVEELRSLHIVDLDLWLLKVYHYYIENGFYAKIVNSVSHIWYTQSYELSLLSLRFLYSQAIWFYDYIFYIFACICRLECSRDVSFCWNFVSYKDSAALSN